MQIASEMGAVNEMVQTEETLRSWARCHVEDNYTRGDLGYCHPNAAAWSREENFPVAALVHLMEDWTTWFQDELDMDRDDEMGRDWAALLTEDIRDEIFVLVRDGKGYIWDGWHRAAATIVSGREFIPAIVGRPKM